MSKAKTEMALSSWAYDLMNFHECSNIHIRDCSGLMISCTFMYENTYICMEMDWIQDMLFQAWYNAVKIPIRNAAQPYEDGL